MQLCPPVINMPSQDKHAILTIEPHVELLDAVPAHVPYEVGQRLFFEEVHPQQVEPPCCPTIPYSTSDI